MKTSGLNTLRGKERGTVHGAVNSEVAVDPSGGQAIVTVITRLSAVALGLPVGH